MRLQIGATLYATMISHFQSKDDCASERRRLGSDEENGDRPTKTVRDSTPFGLRFRPAGQSGADARMRGVDRGRSAARDLRRSHRDLGVSDPLRRFDGNAERISGGWASPAPRIAFEFGRRRGGRLGQRSEARKSRNPKTEVREAQGAARRARQLRHGDGVLDQRSEEEEMTMPVRTTEAPVTPSHPFERRGRTTCRRPEPIGS